MWLQPQMGRLPSFPNLQAFYHSDLRIAAVLKTKRAVWSMNSNSILTDDMMNNALLRVARGHQWRCSNNKNQWLPTKADSWRLFKVQSPIHWLSLSLNNTNFVWWHPWWLIINYLIRKLDRLAGKSEKVGPPAWAPQRLRMDAPLTAWGLQFVLSML